jgi:hypothetical protein
MRSKYLVMTRRTSSGSRRSLRAVEPTTSVNRMVTVFRDRMTGTYSLPVLVTDPPRGVAGAGDRRDP